jgi:DNA-binding NtrC family response regulator
VRREAPLVLVDATIAREHDVERWKNPDVSPLALANRGLLVLLDGAALPFDVQEIIARSLSERRVPWERPDAIDVQLALTATTAPAQLVAEGRLGGALALRLGDALDAPVELPRLAERTEDLRSILTDRLAREGLRVVGRPVGIEHAAFARLVDYRFPGEDAELAAIVQRLVSLCSAAGREVVRAADVDAVGLGAAPGEARQKDPISA